MNEDQTLNKRPSFIVDDNKSLLEKIPINTKIECLKIAQAIEPHNILEKAKELFDWIMEPTHETASTVQ